MHIPVLVIQRLHEFSIPAITLIKPSYMPDCRVHVIHFLNILTLTMIGAIVVHPDMDVRNRTNSGFPYGIAMLMRFTIRISMIRSLKLQI